MTPHGGNLASPTVLLLYRPLLVQSKHEVWCSVILVYKLEQQQWLA
jgi:hypothetical protein